MLMSQKLHTRIAGFTLVEIMIVVGIIALLAAIAIPGFIRARLRSQASTVLSELRVIDTAKSQYLIDVNDTYIANFSASNLRPYIKLGSSLYSDLDDNLVLRMNGDVIIYYGDSPSIPGVSIPTDMAQVTDVDFWSPYPVAVNAVPNL